MLRHENRMSAEGSLLAIIRRSRGREPASDQLLSLDEYSFEPTAFDVRPLCRTDVESPTKRGTREGVEQFIEASHTELSAGTPPAQVDRDDTGRAARSTRAALPRPSAA
jgi:hypothetical protein